MMSLTHPVSVHPKRKNPYVAMLRRHLGEGVMHLFKRDDVVEIYTNENGGLFAVVSGKGRVEVGQLAPGRVERFLNALATMHDLVLDERVRDLEAELPHEVFGGARVKGWLPPVTTAPVLIVRKHASSVIPLVDMIRQELLDRNQADRLLDALDARLNVVIAGGTLTGKTTFANALIREIARRHPEQRFVILEDTRELRVEATDILRLRTVEELGYSLKTLVKGTLRSTPDRIIVGEVRDASAAQLLDAWSTGHPGGIATVHAGSAQETLERLTELTETVERPGGNPRLVARAVDLVVVLKLEAEEGRGASSENGTARPRYRRVVSEIVTVQSGLDAAGGFRTEAW